MMNDIFRDLIAEGVVCVYLNNILICTKIQEEHRYIVCLVLEWLCQHQLYLKPEKCKFEQQKVEYLGAIISENQVEMDPLKVRGIAEWPTLMNVSDIRKFCSFANYEQRFIKDFSAVCKPLDQLTDSVPWQWGDEEQHVFQELK